MYFKLNFPNYNQNVLFFIYCICKCNVHTTDYVGLLGPLSNSFLILKFGIFYQEFIKSC